ncbi:helix-turn-helix transcriptional regulator [Ancylobacter sp. VNQ12]|uniref:helix-turn-helix transcriptional regulator n=1 Tax=Ancylobacter sp. VNQ12 TaxID=3400920 RepID=UPI003BFD309B
MTYRTTSASQHLYKTWDFIERMEQAPDALSVERCLMDLAELFGFTSVFGGVVPGQEVTREEIPSRIIIQRMPIEWARRYNNHDYVFRDPIVSHLQSARAPFSWDEAYAASLNSTDVKLIRGEASAFGLRAGHVVPVPTLDGSLATISFGGEAPEMSADATDALTFAAAYAVGRLLHVPRRSVDVEVAMTPRETDVLLWAAEGKSDWDIATILGISRPTVLKHMRSARDKLDAMNRTHAVVDLRP